MFFLVLGMFWCIELNGTFLVCNWIFYCFSNNFTAVIYLSVGTVEIRVCLSYKKRIASSCRHNVYCWNRPVLWTDTSEPRLTCCHLYIVLLRVFSMHHFGTSENVLCPFNTFPLESYLVIPSLWLYLPVYRTFTTFNQSSECNCYFFEYCLQGHRVHCLVSRTMSAVYRRLKS